MEFSEAFKDFLLAHGKTIDDLKSLGLVPAVAAGDNSTNNVHIVDEAKVAQSDPKPSNPSRSYRRLRLFSGRSPVPAGELDFDNWQRLARQLLRDDSIPDGEKKSRLTEALVPPALNVIWAVPDGSSADTYLDCLSRAYGSTADGEELLTTFRCSYQREEEKSSEYLLRIYTLLTQVVEMGGLAAADSDKALCSQFQRGCLYNEALLNMLQLSAKKDSPPPMLVLLREVRAAETLLEEKSDRRKGPAKQKRATSFVQTASAPKPVKESPSAASQPQTGGEVEELRQAVDRLHRRLDGLFRSRQDPPARDQVPTAARRYVRRVLFCYNCGEDGHRMDACTNERNPSLVQEKMVSRQSAQRSSGNGSGQL